MNDILYFDESATTKPKQEVIDAIIPYLTEKWCNPSSLYSGSVDVKKDIEEARKVIADFINAEPEEIYFTSGASESNSWALQGFTNSRMYPYILYSSIEHKSILSCIQGINCNLDYFQYNQIDVDECGFIKINELKNNLVCSYNTDVLVTIQLANNEIGTIQDIKAISDLVHKYNGVFHTDATQVFGKFPINVKELGIDMISASAHKIGGIKGSGFLYIKKGIEISPLIYGSQEGAMRGGTENVAGIIGLAKAVELCDINLYTINQKYDVKNNVITYLEKEFCCKLNGSRYNSLPNIINVTFPQNLTGESLLYTLDLDDIAISTGSACNSYLIEPSYVLKAIGLSDEEAMRTIRITLPDIYGYNVDEYFDMLNEFMEKLTKAIKLLTI